jgi:hypothetical protein
MSLRRLLVLAAFPIAAALACSSDPYAPKALSEVRADTLRVLALNGTPAEAQSGVRLISGQAQVPDYSEQFDFALDINGSGEVVIIPRSKVVTCRTPCQLGMQLIPAATTKFDELYDAPKTGYTYDSLTVVPVGVTAVFVSKEVFCEPSNISTYDIYAKMIIDSVHVADRAIFARVVADPNCGFRGLVPGIVPGH